MLYDLFPLSILSYGTFCAGPDSACIGDNRAGLSRRGRGRVLSRSISENL
jgi:hypothetical protein